MKNNLFENIPESLTEEIIETIAKSDSVNIERIVSQGHSTPDNFWYDQQKNEFVILLTGKADLIFMDEEVIHLTPGDFINIPAHKKHRVEWTDENQKSIWIAVHY